MNIETQPSPDGAFFQHSITGEVDREPPKNFTDTIIDLQRIESGDNYPIVTSWQEGANWVIEVSLWSQNPSPSAEEIASLTGSFAEVIASTHL